VITAWIIVGIVICSAELLLWVVFRSKICCIGFPRERDQSALRLVTMRRWGFLAIIHTIVLLLAYVIPTSFLW
jgi:hypothetical protein